MRHFNSQMVVEGKLYILLRLQHSEVIVEVCGLKALRGEVFGSSHSFIVSEHEASNGLDIVQDYQYSKHMGRRIKRTNVPQRRGRW
jgi:hypothetical protein